jgi:hypothetical protein
VTRLLPARPPSHRRQGHDRQTRAAAPLRERVPEQVEEAVLTALEKIPADRFATTAEFASALTGPARPRSASRSRSLAGGPAQLAALVGWSRAWPGGCSAEPKGGGTDPNRIVMTQNSFRQEAIFVARWGPGRPHHRVQRELARPGSPAPRHPSRLPRAGAAGTPIRPTCWPCRVPASSRFLTHARYVNHREFTGTLARMPLGGGTPRR